MLNCILSHLNRDPLDLLEMAVKLLENLSGPYQTSKGLMKK